MHGNPALWGQLMDRLAAMSVAFLRAQIEAGAQAVQLFDSWAGSLSPAEYRSFVLPATRAVLEGIADLGVPSILFGVGTGELLGDMATAGAQVIGVDWRVPLDVARSRVGPDHAVQGNLDPALCVAPWPVVEAAARQVLAEGAADGSGTGHIFNLGHGVLPEADIGILGARGRPRARGDRAGMSRFRRGPAGRRARHGARHAAAPRGDRALLHPHPPRPAADTRAAGRARAALRRDRRALAPHRAAPWRRSTGCAAALDRRAPGHYVVAYGAKHADPLIEAAAAGL